MLLCSLNHLFSLHYSKCAVSTAFLPIALAAAVLPRPTLASWDECSLNSFRYSDNECKNDISSIYSIGTTASVCVETFTKVHPEVEKSPVHIRAKLFGNESYYRFVASETVRASGLPLPSGDERSPPPTLRMRAELHVLSQLHEQLLYLRAHRTELRRFFATTGTSSSAIRCAILQSECHTAYRIVQLTPNEKCVSIGKSLLDAQYEEDFDAFGFITEGARLRRIVLYERSPQGINGSFGDRIRNAYRALQPGGRVTILLSKEQEVWANRIVQWLNENDLNPLLKRLSDGFSLDGLKAFPGRPLNVGTTNRLSGRFPSPRVINLERRGDKWANFRSGAARCRV